MTTSRAKQTASNGPVSTARQRPGGRFGRTAEQLRATAYHEAGHFVVLYTLGYVSISISIIPGDDGSFGRNKTGSIYDYDHRNERELRQVARASVVSQFAGLPAQRLVEPDASDWNAEDDEKLVWNVCTWAGLAPGGCSWETSDIPHT